MARDPKAVVRRFLDDGWDPVAGRWDADVIAECFDVERYHSHTWGAGLVETGRRMGEFFSGLGPRQPVTEALVAEGDRVVHHVTWRATHVGPVLGVAATGRTVEVHHVEIWRVEDGRIVEHWGGIGEAAHLLAQIT
jgi:predicted SnoaL-like aldol condensation-catalyzing enzyme